MSYATRHRFAGKAEARLRKSRYPIRLVTAASLFDGYDAALCSIGCIMRASGAEVVQFSALSQLSRSHEYHSPRRPCE
ncbi:MAG: hypothetical protein N2253_01390 [Bacteroidia bacterium]|nr:hypothetical protein [Bacteroidia bacterium]MCX7763530.1 hypothetical protein [Bacteroidia bacterium]MDW8057355.1 hypothetical protein [Bacteroidia bacterium]